MLLDTCGPTQPQRGHAAACALGKEKAFVVKTAKTLLTGKRPDHQSVASAGWSHSLETAAAPPGKEKKKINVEVPRLLVLLVLLVRRVAFSAVTVVFVLFFCVCCLSWFERKLYWLWAALASKARSIKSLSVKKKKCAV